MWVSTRRCIAHHPLIRRVLGFDAIISIHSFAGEAHANQAPRPACQDQTGLSVIPERPKRPIIAASRKTEKSIQSRKRKVRADTETVSVVGDLHSMESFTIHSISPPKLPEFLQLCQFRCFHGTFSWFRHLCGVLDTSIPPFERDNDRGAVILCSQLLCESHNLPCSNLWAQFGTGSNQICDLWVR